MPKLRVSSFSISLDGYGAGPDQGLEHPLGRGGEALHEWLFATRTPQQTGSSDTGTTGTDERFMARGLDNDGAWILGRNMFGPMRGPWPDESWHGWWGENPPFHVPVFVLTHHTRPPLEMEGGTTFYFVTEGIEDALARAGDAAGARDVRLGGGAATIRQYLAVGLVEELHVAVIPVLLGRGEPLFDGLDLPALGYEVTEYVPSDATTHVVLTKVR